MSNHGSKGKPADPPKGQVANQPGTKPKDGQVDKANQGGGAKQDNGQPVGSGSGAPPTGR